MRDVGGWVGWEVWGGGGYVEGGTKQESVRMKG